MTDEDARFDALQQRLHEIWPAIRTWSDVPQTVIVVPSYALDEDVLAAVGSILPAYEERFLYLLLLLRQARCRVVFVTSVPVRPTLVDYWLDLVPGVDADDARSRLRLITVDDAAPRPLTAKLLARPDVLAAIADAIDGPAHLVMFNVTDLERDLALALDVPVFGAAPRHAPWGSKAGARRLFAEEGVPHPAGAEIAGTDVDAAVAVLRGASDAPVVVKLNDGVGGLGNIVVPAGATAGPLLSDVFRAELAHQGGIVEELVEGDVCSPSVQLRITPPGELEVLSTHDQLLTGQHYVGCRFPADPAYAATAGKLACVVGRRLASEGVIGRFAVDFVVARRGDGWAPSAIEINLRKGGTTHPFLTMQYLVGGAYEADAGRFVTADGETRCYVAADGLGERACIGVEPEAVIGAVRADGLAFDPATRRGVVLQMLSALPAAGKYGATAIGTSDADADAQYAAVQDIVRRLGARG